MESVKQQMDRHIGEIKSDTSWLKAELEYFYEISKAVIPKGNNSVIPKEDKALSPEGIRNITHNITIDNTMWENNNW